jgi:hypothetical protein
MNKDDLDIFNNIPPFGNYFREVYNKKWFRIHSLYNGKRYSDSEIENKEILLRNQTVFNKIMNGEIVGFLTAFDSSLESQNKQWINSLDLHYFTTYDIAEDEDNEYLVDAYYFILNKSKLNDSMILDIAGDDFDGELLFYSLNTGNIFAPYDGGIDLIIENSKELIKCKKYFSKWLSNRKDGL